MKAGLVFSVLIMVICSSLSAADLTVKVGGFWAETDSWITTTTLTGKPIKLDFEDTLNLQERQALPFLQVDYAFKDKHHLYFDWRRLHRTSESTVTFDFLLPNNPDAGVSAGAKLTTRLDIDILQASYGYAVYQSERAEVGLSVGFHIMFVELGFSGDISACVSDDGVSSCNAASSGEVVDNSLTAPLPDFGIWGSYQFSDHFTLKAHPQLFYIEINDVYGYLADLNVALSYQINHSWDIELGYNYYLVKAEWDQSILKYTYRGPMLNVAYRF